MGCVSSPAVAGEESHRDQRRDGRLREGVLHFSVPEDAPPPGGKRAEPGPGSGDPNMNVGAPRLQLSQSEDHDETGQNQQHGHVTSDYIRIFDTVSREL